jgi:hypothetical protein
LEQPPLDATEVIMVPFAGEGAGEEGLTWGQQHIWGAIQALGSTMNMIAVRELEPGAEPAEFVGELAYYLGRFQAMRTVLRMVPGGLPRQIVVESGEAPLEIIDLPAAADPAAAAAAVAVQEDDREFDYTTDFPIRMILIRHDGRLTHLVTTLSHFASDGAGGFAMYRDYVERDVPGGRSAVPPATQPLDLARKQAKPFAKLQSETALTYWEDRLRAIPARRFRAPVDHGGPRYWKLKVDSPATFLAVRSVAARLGTDVSTALLAVYSVALARRTGNNPTVAQMLVSNRFRPGMADMVSNISQSGLFVVDVADTTVDDAVRRAGRAVARTYKNAYFDLAAQRELIARVNRERGEEVELSNYYNDRPSQYQSGDPGQMPTAAEIEEARSRTTPPEWTELDNFNERLMVTIDDMPDTIVLLVYADTHYVPREEMAALAGEIETLAVAAATDPETPTGVEAGDGPAPGAGAEREVVG